MENDQQRHLVSSSSAGCSARLELDVAQEHRLFFTTLLQSGIELDTESGMPLGEFLENSAGICRQYLTDTVQTIFLNGTAVDNLHVPLTGSHPVIALSAAMPGLAGAIFRRNGLHASLRTTHLTDRTETHSRKPITATLKLFNQIARERGEAMLTAGVVLASSSVISFLRGRPELMGMIQRARIDATEVAVGEIPERLGEATFIRVTISDEKAPETADSPCPTTGS